MGFYIEVPRHHDKAQQLIDLYGARKIDVREAEKILSEPNRTQGVVVVVDNGIFEAAGYCYNMREWIDFRPTNSDRRRRWYLAMDRAKAEELSGFAQVREDYFDDDMQELR